MLFAEHINTNAALLMTDIRSIISESADLILHVQKKEMVTRVYDRIKYLQKKNFQHGLKHVEDGQSESTGLWFTSVSSVVSGPTRQIGWNKDDVDAIQKAFNQFDKCPLKSKILEIFQSNEHLREVQERNTFKRGYEKVKTTFKQRTKLKRVGAPLVATVVP